MKAHSINGSKIWNSLADGTVRAEGLVAQAVGRPALLPQIFAGLEQPKARVKFGCAKVLLLASESSPKTILPYWEQLTARMNHENKILQWSAMLTLANLAPVASLPIVEALLPRLLAPIHGPVMITAANAIRSATGFALAHPSLAPWVSRKILEVETGDYQTAECRNVVIGHALQMLDRLMPLLKDKEPVLQFAQRQLQNSRPATRRRAQAFVSKHNRPRE